MKVLFKKACFSILALAVFFALERFCHAKTGGFATVNIYPPQGSSFSSEEKAGSHVHDLMLNQTFTFLSSGGQCYIFLSADETMVLKLFKFQHMRIPPWLELLPLPKALHQIRQEKRQKKLNKLEFTFKSCEIAEVELSEETAVMYTHLKKTRGMGTLTLKDKMGILHRLSLDEIPFILQKKALEASSTLHKWMEEGETERAKAGIDKLLLLVSNRSKKGIGDKDPNFYTNFGFIGDEPVQIDIGRFFHTSENVYEFERLAISCQRWIQENHRELLPFVQHEIALLSEGSL